MKTFPAETSVRLHWI